LNRLTKIGLLCSRRQGNLKYYQVNKECPIYPELKSVVFKTTGIGQTLKDNLTELGQIDQAFIYGSVARADEGADSDIDLLIVGEVELSRLRQLLRDLERHLGREINETVYGKGEFIQRQQEGDAFLLRVLSAPKIVLVGKDHDLQ
jgi:predicted nucleotidyltransferase